MYADAGYSVQEVGQTDPDSMQYLVLGLPSPVHLKTIIYHFD
jgi:hypothetical protein